MNEIRPSLGLTSRAIGISKSTVYRWSRRIPEFGDKLAEESLRAFCDRFRKTLDRIEKQQKRRA